MVRAVLARPRGADPTRFEGVYLHNAGSPAELGPVLWTLMRDRYRFDAAGFSREMIDANLAGWSNIDCLGGPLATTWDGTTKLTVEQHQDNFDADREDEGPTSFQNDPQREVPGITAPPIDDTSDNWGADLVYVVASDALHILVPEGGAYTLLASLPWGDEPDWDSLDDAMNDAYADMEEAAKSHDPDDDDGGSYSYEDEDAHETTESLAAVTASFDRVQRGDVAGAQAGLLRYLAAGGARTPKVLANLYFTLNHQPLPAAKVIALLDETLAALHGEPKLLMPALVENICIVANNHGRGRDSIQLFELALTHGRPLSAPCYVGMTYGAFTAQDPVLMRRAVDHVERVMSEQPDLLAKTPTVFDNTAALYVALGDKAKGLLYIRLCKEHDYENFEAMPSMPDYASIKDDPDFLALFR